MKKSEPKYNSVAYRFGLIKYDENKPDVNDKRKKFAQAVFSYQTPNGIEFRRSFQLPSFTPENEFFKYAPTEILVYDDTKK
jgi:hypothetical protein